MKMTANKLLIAGLFCVMSSSCFADNRDRGISYSPDHWPSRWSSAIRQQQSGGYPTRKIERTPPPELPSTGSLTGVSEQDLFYSPERNSFRQNRTTRSDSPHYLRENRSYTRESRKPAYAYYGMPPAVYSYPGYANGLANIATDPVLGHPGVGIPIMPGIPYGYPFMGLGPVYYPGMVYPGSMGMWNPPFGAW